MAKKLKLKKGDRVWLSLPANGVIKSVNKKYGYTITIDDGNDGSDTQYYDDSEVVKIT